MKKFFATFLCLVLCGGLLPAQAAGPEVNAKAVLLMEKTTGQVLYEEHAHDPLELASVTKVMTMLLIMEALEEGTITKETMVPVSATAAGMGGSQVYMKEGESFSVHDMLKAIAVASGNDAAVALAEKVIADDDTVDAYFDKVKQALIRRIADDPAEGGTALELLMIAKYLERIGDHATNIAEWVEFSVTGVHKEE